MSRLHHWLFLFGVLMILPHPAGRVVSFEFIVGDQVVFEASTLDEGEPADTVWNYLQSIPIKRPDQIYRVSEETQEFLNDYHRSLESHIHNDRLIVPGPMRIFCRYGGQIVVPSLSLQRSGPNAEWHIDPQQVADTFALRTVDRQQRSRRVFDEQAAKTKTTVPEQRAAQRYVGFRGYQRSITCQNPEVQQWFDQGLQLLYGFNHDEAIRSFQEAARLEPGCAMAWWGIAYAHGLHINNPVMSETQSQLAFEAAQKAVAAVDDESPAERALVSAVGKRYAWPAPETREALDSAYAHAMQEAWRDHPQDADIGALFAESLMNLQPWDLWTAAGEPKGRTSEIVEVLEQVLQQHPLHPGANHFYIHAVEASPTPEKGLAAADRLLNLVPGSGHLVHMPSHIYIRVGRYADAAWANELAIGADATYFEIAPPPNFYNVYHLHNLHFLAYAAMMEGRQAVATQAARRIEATIPAAFLKEHVHVADGFMPTILHVMIRFGRWELILQEPRPPEWRWLSLATWHYARAVALANLKRFSEAEGELANLREVQSKFTEEWRLGNNLAMDVVAIAEQMALGELLFHRGEVELGLTHLRNAVALEDQLVYDEPPGWMQPVRHALGALLLSANQTEEALQIYDRDLSEHPQNAWSLLGKQQALVAGGQAAAAQQMDEPVKAAWSRADVTPPGSCYCRSPGR